MPETPKDKTLKVPVGTHARLHKFCRALELLDFLDQREHHHVSAGDAIVRLLDQAWAKEVLDGPKLVASSKT